MQKKISWLVAVAAVSLGLAWVIGRTPVAPKSEVASRVSPPARTEPAPPAPAPVPPAGETPKPDIVEVPAPAAPLAVQPPSASPPTPAPEVKPARPQAAKPAGKKPALVDPLAREALAMVGTDADAEQYWFYAINNPDLPPKEREDLIEDLNEEGFGDPKHPTPEELPLILSRLEMILDLAPYAMDEVNLKSFAEAYKDLVNMAHLAADSGYGKPVK